MRNLLLLLSLFFTATAFGQKIIDTTELYNGELTLKRIEFKSTGEISKEIYYHPSGKIKIEYFFNNGKKIRWIAYDTTGNQISEWNDPEIGYARKRKLRNITFSITLLAIVGLIIAVSRISYRNTYYSILILSVIYPFIVFLTQGLISTNDANPVFALVIVSTLVILPGLLLVLSFINFFNRSKIPIATSIFAILISIGFWCSSL